MSIICLALYTYTYRGDSNEIHESFEMRPGSNKTRIKLPPSPRRKIPTTHSSTPLATLTHAHPIPIPTPSPHPHPHPHPHRSPVSTGKSLRAALTRAQKKRVGDPKHRFMHWQMAIITIFYDLVCSQAQHVCIGITLGPRVTPLNLFSWAAFNTCRITVVCCKLFRLRIHIIPNPSFTGWPPEQPSACLSVVNSLTYQLLLLLSITPTIYCNLLITKIRG